MLTWTFLLFFILFSPLWENILKNQLKINFLYRFGCNVARHQDGKWALADTVTTAEWVPQLQSRVFHPTARPNTVFLSDARWVDLAVTRHPSLLLSVAPCSLIMLFFFPQHVHIYSFLVICWSRSGHVIQSPFVPLCFYRAGLEAFVVFIGEHKSLPFVYVSQ